LHPLLRRLTLPFLYRDKYGPTWPAGDMTDYFQLHEPLRQYFIFQLFDSLFKVFHQVTLFL